MAPVYKPAVPYISIFFSFHLLSNAVGPVRVQWDKQWVEWESTLTVCGYCSYSVGKWGIVGQRDSRFGRGHRCIAGLIN